MRLYWLLEYLLDKILPLFAKIKMKNMNSRKGFIQKFCIEKKNYLLNLLAISDNKSYFS